MTSKALWRSVRMLLAVVGVRALGLTTAPATNTAAAGAGSPIIRTRTLLDSPPPFPAGAPCPFQVNVAVTGRKTTRSGPDKTIINEEAKVTLTNASTGASLVHVTAFRYTEVSLPGGLLQYDISGRTILITRAGDVGPKGPVGSAGALYSLVGHAIGVFNETTNRWTSFSVNGQVFDLCGLLGS
jgi:hypothetical protein